MLANLKKFFAAEVVIEETRSDAEKQAAATALLVEAAMMDGAFDAAERAVIAAICESHFELSALEAEELILEAEASIAANPSLQRYTQAVKEHFSHDERVEIIEMLWQVAYADGKLHDYESNLLRRVGGLIYVSDKERGAARKRVLARMGLSS